MLLILLVSGLVSAAPAHAEEREPYASSSINRYQVTLAARGCGGYREVVAGQVRDDADEATERPGVDSPYQPGQEVDPKIESEKDSGCVDLPGWRFTFGSGHQRKGSLSVVTGISSTTEPTRDATDELDDNGKGIGTQVGGAVTATLTDEEVRLANRRQLWVQGGTPDQPMQSGYGFGGLRCAVDGRTGGNVQWVSFPAGVRHVFCFAYYVKNPRDTGTVTVRLRPSRPVGYPQRVAFQSDLSHAPEGKFGLTSSGDAVDTSFTRAAGSDPYPLVAQPPAGWKVADVACAVTRSSGGQAGSTATTDVPTAKVVIVLAPRDQVTCTFTVDPPPVPAGLSLKVYTAGAAAPFQVRIGTQTLTATTNTEPVPAAVSGADLSTLAAGTYTVAVASTATGWTLTGAVCNGAPIQASAATVPVNLVDGVPTECALRVVVRPPAPKLNVITKGGVASGGFSVAPADAAGAGWWAAAVTTKAGVATAASGDIPGDLPSGAYVVTAVPPRSDLTGGWKLSSFACTPADRNPATGALATITIVPGGPDPVCTATYEFDAATYLQVTVRATGSESGRAAPAVLEVSCVDGSAGRVVLDTTEGASTGLPESLAFLAPTDCTITQPSTGAARTSEVKTTVALDPPAGDGPLSLPAQVQVARTVAKYTLAVTDDFSPAAVPQTKSILDELKSLPVVLVGIGIFFLGALIFMGVLLRRNAA